MVVDATRFRSLYFGMASAEDEVAEDENRFVETYFDRWNIAESIDEYKFYLVLGPKGSGKSAAIEYLMLSLERKYGEYCSFFDRIDFDKVAPGASPLEAATRKLVSAEAPAITDSAWRFYIAVRLLELVLRDHSSSLHRDERIPILMTNLGNMGLMTKDFPTILRRVRERKSRVDAKVASHEWVTKVEQLPLDRVGEEILKLVVEQQSGGHYVLSIDGLDKIIVNNEAYWLTLAALLREGRALRNELHRASADIRLYIMCRSDVFRRIRFADADKIAGGASMFVDWSTQQTRAEDSPLWEYLAHKASVSVGDLLNMLPSHVTVGERTGRPKAIQAPEYLLQFTRSTPREATLLMNRLKFEIPKGGYPDERRVRLAADSFASHDLLTIVTAESTGLLREEIQDRLESIIGSLPCAVNLKVEDFRKAAVSNGLKKEHLNELIEFFFLAGLIGNYDPATGYVQFSYRRDTHKLRRNGPFNLHVGLMYAFNVPYARRN